MKIDKEIVNLLKDIKKQNNTIIKILKNIDIGVAEANGYYINEELDEDLSNDSDSENS